VATAVGGGLNELTQQAAEGGDLKTPSQGSRGLRQNRCG
jgi:hypothetical protein